VKMLNNKDRLIYEQYERLRRDPATNHDHLLTAADVVLNASKYLPPLEVEEVTNALRHFMIHACDINEEDMDLEISNEPSNWKELYSASEREIWNSAKSLGVPFQAFLSLARLDTLHLEESQVLQDYAITLSALHQSFTCEEERHMNEKKESFTQIVETVTAVVICFNAITLGLEADSTKGIIWFGIESGFTAYYTCEVAVKMFSRGCTWYFCGAHWQWNLYDLVVVVIGAMNVGLEMHFWSLGASPLSPHIGVVKTVTVMTQLARLVRLLRFKIFAELKAMVQGVVTGLRVLFWAVVLLGSFIY